MKTIGTKLYFTALETVYSYNGSVAIEDTLVGHSPYSIVEYEYIYIGEYASFTVDGRLYRLDPAGLVMVCDVLNTQRAVLGLAVFENRLFGSTSYGGRLFRYDYIPPAPPVGSGVGLEFACGSCSPGGGVGIEFVCSDAMKAGGGVGVEFAV